MNLSREICTRNKLTHKMRGGNSRKSETMRFLVLLDFRNEGERGMGI